MIELEKRTFSETKLYKISDIVTISYPGAFPKANFGRVKRQLRDDAKRGLLEINIILHRLSNYEKDGMMVFNEPSRYVDEILTSREFNDLIEKMYIGSKTIPASDRAVGFAAQQFGKSLAALIRTVPNEFTQLLADSLQPFMKLFNAVVNYDINSKESVKTKSQWFSTEMVQNRFSLNLDPLIDPLQRSKIIDREYYG